MASAWLESEPVKILTLVGTVIGLIVGCIQLWLWYGRGRARAAGLLAAALIAVGFLFWCVRALIDFVRLDVEPSLRAPINLPPLAQLWPALDGLVRTALNFAPPFAAWAVTVVLVAGLVMAVGSLHFSPLYSGIAETLTDVVFGGVWAAVRLTAYAVIAYAFLLPGVHASSGAWRTGVFDLAVVASSAIGVVPAIRRAKTWERCLDGFYVRTLILIRRTLKDVKAGVPLADSRSFIALDSSYPECVPIHNELRSWYRGGVGSIYAEIATRHNDKEMMNVLINEFRDSFVSSHYKEHSGNSGLYEKAHFLMDYPSEAVLAALKSFDGREYQVYGDFGSSWLKISLAHEVATVQHQLASVPRPKTSPSGS